MIFVTVGTTYFDELIMEVDRLAGSGELGQEVIAQRGSGAYEPKNIESFAFKPGLGEYYERADLIVSHAAAGTLFTALNVGKRIVAVSNPRLGLYRSGDARRAYSRTKGREFELTNRQMALPMKLEDEGYLVWCPDVAELEGAIKEAAIKPLKAYKKPECGIARHVGKLLDSGG